MSASTEPAGGPFPRLDRLYPLTEDDVRAYRRDGHVFLPSVLSRDEAAAYRPAVAAAVTGQQAKLTAAERALGGSSSHLAFPLGEAPSAIRRLITSPRLAAIARQLLGTRAVRILHYYGFFKAAGGPGTPWHQDSLFLPLDRDVVTVWLPLVPVPAEVAMVFANGSQSGGFFDLGGGEDGDGDPVPAAMQRRGFILEGGQALEPGDADYHSGMVVHCAPPNTTAATREVIAVCYYPADSRLVPAGEILRHPGGEAGQVYREVLRRQYFPGLRDGDIARGESNVVVFPPPAPRAANPFDEEMEIGGAAVERFRRLGHVLVRQAATPEEMDEYGPALRAAVERHNLDRHAMERQVAGNDQGWKFVNNLWRLDDRARDLVLGRRFGRMAADLLGVDRVRLFRDQSYFKLPGAGNTAWHQDAYFMPLDGAAVVTMWIATAGVEVSMAPMLFADGSHTAGYLGTSLPDDEAMDAFERSLLERGMPVTCYGAMAAGDASFHSGWTLHASRSNRGARLREAMVVVFFADGARVRLPEVPADAAPQEHFAARIREQNLQESLPGLAPGALAATNWTPVVFER